MNQADTVIHVYLQNRAAKLRERYVQATPFKIHTHIFKANGQCTLYLMGFQRVSSYDYEL